jgi:uncharacterized protein with ParB-like and HNH nuclease domain
MATNSISVYNFFTSSNLKKLIIPMFQRPYSWRLEQIEEFFNDLTPLLANPNLKHFLGLVVLVKDEKEGVYEIIDGQQRLTTISITLSILRDKLDDLRENNLSKLSKSTRAKIDESFHKIENCLIYKDRSGKRDLKLVTKSGREYEQRFLENVLVSISDLVQTDIRNMNYNNQPDFEKNIFQIKSMFMSEKPFDQRKAKSYRSFKNFAIIYEIINSKSFLGSLSTLDDQINFVCDSLIPALLDSIHIIDFVSDTHSDAFNTFEVLNNRGLAISSTDLIKNICLKRASNQGEQDEIFKLWNSIFDQALNNQDDIQFLRYSNNSRRDFVTKTELYDSFNGFILKMNVNQLKTFLENELLVDAQIFTLLKDFECTFPQTNIHNVIKLLQSTKSNQWISIAIAAIRAYQQFKNIQVSEKLCELLENVHEIIFCMILKDRKANLIEQRFPEIAQGIVGFNNVNELIQLYENSISELKKFRDLEKLNYNSIDLIDVDYSSNNLNGAIVLSFIEYKTSHGNLSIRSLEHILPQNPKELNWPIIKGIHPDKIDDNIYSLGNMLLIDKPLNSKVKASAFDIKVDAYGKHKIFDPVGQSSQNNYKKLTSLDFSKIENRTKELLMMYKSSI